MAMWAAIFAGGCTLFAALVVFILTHTTDTRRRSDLRMIEVCTELLQLLAASRVVMNNDVCEAGWIAADPRQIEENITNEWQFEARAHGTERLFRAKGLAYANRLDELLPLIDAATSAYFDVYDEIGDVERHARLFMDKHAKDVRGLSSEQFRLHYEYDDGVQAMAESEKRARQHVTEFLTVCAELIGRISRIQRLKVEALDMAWWDRLASGVDQRLEQTRDEAVSAPALSVVNKRVQFGAD